MRPVTRSLSVVAVALGLLSMTQAQQQLCTGVIPDAQAAACVGKAVTVRGVVSNVHTSSKGNTFLNLGRPYPNQTFSAVIFSSAADRFPNPKQWTGRKVQIHGVVKLYNGRPEIILEEASQLRELK